ncbi:hypothetical protein OTU49_009633 [Cherax quadricarinatus]|uniref:Uncharacterized protein n=1 Tax=Cherax quadricarinatus TaxID=27406 RepID=A0AAW0WB11_CHEQU
MLKSSHAEMSPERMYHSVTQGTAYDNCRLADMFKILWMKCSSSPPEEIKVWTENVFADNPKEKMGVSELVKILEKLQENGPSPSPSVLDGRTDLTHQPSIKSPQCQGENMCQDSPKNDSKRKREDESEDTTTKNSKRRREEDNSEGDLEKDGMNLTHKSSTENPESQRDICEDHPKKNNKRTRE